MAWRRTATGWQSDDGRVIRRVPKRSGVRNTQAAAAMLGRSIAREARCTCGWAQRAVDLTTANEYWWAHEEATAGDGRSHAVSYSEEGGGTTT